MFTLFGMEQKKILLSKEGGIRLFSDEPPFVAMELERQELIAIMLTHSIESLWKQASE